MNEIKIKPVLTDVGKRRLLENKFNITKFSLADDGINYRLINNNLQQPSLSLERTPVFKTWRESSFNLNNKLIVKRSSSYQSEKNFKPKIIYKNDEITIHPKGFKKEINFPLIINQDDIFTIQFYITNNDIAQKKVDIEFAFNEKNIDLVLNATISESIYFDVYTPHLKNRSINLEDSLHFNNEKRKFPKSVNILCDNKNSINNSFILSYKGNFGWTSLDTEVYETSLKLMDEVTGQFQIIKLQIIPLESVNDIQPAPIIQETLSEPDPVIIEIED